MIQTTENVSTNQSNLKSTVVQRANQTVNNFKKSANSRACETGADNTQSTQTKESPKTQKIVKPKDPGLSTKYTKADKRK